MIIPEPLPSWQAYAVAKIAVLVASASPRGDCQQQAAEVTAARVLSTREGVRRMEMAWGSIFSVARPGGIGSGFHSDLEV